MLLLLSEIQCVFPNLTRVLKHVDTYLVCTSCLASRHQNERAVASKHTLYLFCFVCEQWENQSQNVLLETVAGSLVGTSAFLSFKMHLCAPQAFVSPGERSWYHLGQRVRVTAASQTSRSSPHSAHWESLRDRDCYVIQLSASFIFPAAISELIIMSLSAPLHSALIANRSNCVSLLQAQRGGGGGVRLDEWYSVM